VEIDGCDRVFAPSGCGPDAIQPSATATPHVPADVVKDFIDSFRRPLQQPLITSPPRLRVTRKINYDVDDDFVPKCSARLVAKSKFREPKLEAQARKVMMKKLGLETPTEVPDQASFEEFQQAFTLPLSPMTRKAMDALFPARRRLKLAAVTDA
jgi:hypothetical protein